MATLVIMPKLGFNMNEGKLVKWYKQEGEAVKKGETLFSIETDKTNIDIEATTDGCVRKLLIKEGDKLAVTLPIAILADKDENIAVVLSEANAQLGKEAPIQDVGTGSGFEEKFEAQIKAVKTDPGMVPGKLKASPRAKRKAQDIGIDLTLFDIKGTGFEGGICEKDVVALSESKQKITASPVARRAAAMEGVDLANIAGTGAGGKIMRRDVEDSAGMDATPITEKDTPAATVVSGGKEILENVPYSGVRKIIGERLSGSMQSAPHVYFTRKVNMENLLVLRKQVNENLAIKTSVTDFIAKAVVMALQKYPDLNVSLVGDVIEKYKSINLGIAVAAPTGLIVPVIKESQNLSVAEISGTALKLIEKARNGMLTPDDYTGGTFTISNLGMFGIDQFTAVINPPEAGILAVSATNDEAFVVKKADGTKEIGIKPMMNITLSVDHRVVDGMLAAQFVSEVKELLENPIRLIL